MALEVQPVLEVPGALQNTRIDRDRLPGKERTDFPSSLLRLESRRQRDP